MQAQRMARRALLGLGSDDDDVGPREERVAQDADADASVAVVVGEENQGLHRFRQ